jgi:hypothetical protein
MPFPDLLGADATDAVGGLALKYHYGCELWPYLLVSIGGQNRRGQS